MLKAKPGAEALTIGEFIERYADADEKYELFNGEAVAMAGASSHHNIIATNLLVRLSNYLRGTSCRPFNSDARLELDAGNIRFPDVAIYCDPRDTRVGDVATFSHPRVIIEVLSRSTARFDKLFKMIEYRRIESVDSIVIIEPASRSIELHERINATEWRVLTLIHGAALTLRDPAVTLTADEIFDGIDDGESRDEVDSRG